MNDAPVYQEHRLSCVSVRTKLSDFDRNAEKIDTINYSLIGLIMPFKKSLPELESKTDRNGQRRPPAGCIFLCCNILDSISELYLITLALQRNYLQKCQIFRQKCHNSCLASAIPQSFRPTGPADRTIQLRIARSTTGRISGRIESQLKTENQHRP